MSIHALSENIAMRNVADQLQARMLALQDENTNIPEVTPRERERERLLNCEHYQLQLMDEVSQANGSCNHEQLVVEHLKGQRTSRITQGF